MERIPKGLYTPEFRAEAVKLVEESGLSVDGAARRLSVPKSSVRRLGRRTPFRRRTRGVRYFSIPCLIRHCLTSA